MNITFDMSNDYGFFGFVRVIESSWHPDITKILTE